VLFDDGADCANQVVALGLSDGVQALDGSPVVVTWSFERTVGDDTKLIESLLEGFSDNVVCCISVRTCQGGGREYDGAYCTRT
jgi:hypothetical protein